MTESELHDRAEAIARSGDLQSAVKLLHDQAQGGNPSGLYILANWALAGSLVARDLPLSRNLFEQAALAGHKEAARTARAFIANGTGGPRSWSRALKMTRDAAAADPGAKRDLSIVETMDLTDTGDPRHRPHGDAVSDRPEIHIFRSLLSEAECDFLIACAEPLFAPSNVVDPSTGKLIPHPIRTSEGAAFPLVRETPAIHALNRRLAAASGTRPEQGEPLQVLRYSPDQEYRAHNDGLPATDNQRILTFLVWLNDDYEGGETAFLKTDLKLKGRKGDGLLFRNAGPYQRPDPMSVHAGLPVTSGRKLLASRWIRARDLDLSR